MRRFRLLALGCAGAAFGAAAAPGDLDPTFGPNGLVRLDAVAVTVPEPPSSLVIQADGKLLGCVKTALREVFRQQLRRPPE